MEGGPVHGILGRDAELAEVQSFVGPAPGGPSALLLEGTAGIGKTTLWRAGVSFARARGHRVLSCRPAEAEARLSYAALGDLFDFELPDLPAPQRRALDAALLREEVEGAPPDQRAVSLASLGVLRALAASAPVIIAIDDVQWLDAPSARVLAFVVRRLGDAPIRTLVALRAGSGGDPLALGRAGPAPSLHRVSIGPLREEAMTRLLRARTGGDLTRPILLRLHRISEGNPFFALEIARALTGQGVRPAPGEPLPVPEDLQALLGIRLAALPSGAADGLFVVAAAARPTESLVVAAAGSSRASTGITRAEEAGILQRAGGRIGFTHPLLGSTVYAAATPQARRSVHRRLADLVVDPEERARHLALAASGPHHQVARALEEAGRHARQGGAPDAAAELLELARKLTPPEDSAGLLRRSVEAAEYHFDAGDATRATALLQEAIATARPGRDRARIRLRLASISWLDMPRVQGLSEQALQEAGEDAGTRTALLEHLAWVGIYRGDLAFAAERARASQQWARRTTHPAIQAESLSTFAMVECLQGRPAQDLMTEAVRLEDLAMREAPGESGDGLHRVPDLSRTPAAVGGRAGRRTGGAPPGAGRIRVAGAVCREGRAPHLPGRGGMPGGELGCRRQARPGGLRDRRRVWMGVGAGPHAVPQGAGGGTQGRRGHGSVGRRGRASTVLAERGHARRELQPGGAGVPRALPVEPGAAMERLEPVLAFLDAMGSPEPGVSRACRTRSRPWSPWGGWTRPSDSSIVWSARDEPSIGRGLLTAARGDLSAARSALEQALVERRARQKRAARSTLEQALGLFQALGAPFWAQRAQDDLARVGGPVPASSELTPTEQRIAQLVGEGKKNREVADALFISVKTVEANLSRIFHKLGVRSRTELTRRIAATHRVSSDSSPPHEG